MTFGQIKSIIEKNLVESYKDSSTFKQTLKEFKHNVLKNKSFSKVYSIYDDLNIPQGLSENDAKEFLEESVNVIRHLLENTSLPKNGEKSPNIYQNIDNLVYFENVNIHERLSSKKMLIDNLMLTTKGLNETPKIPLKSMVSIANQTIGKYIEPSIKPLGYDWKIGIAVVSSFAAREVFVGTLATIYSVGNQSGEEATIKEQMKNEIREDGSKTFNFATGISLLIYYALAMQCISTLAIVKKETNSWKWPLVQLLFMSGLAYLSALLAYQILN